MKKKSKLWIVLIVVAVVVVAAAIFGKEYYDNRYIGKDYYTVVPADYDVTLGPIYGMSGEEEGTGVDYKLTAYDENGESKEVEFTVMEGDDLPQPGTYLYVSASVQLVVKWNVTDESSIPAGAMEKINNG